MRRTILVAVALVLGTTQVGWSQSDSAPSRRETMRQRLEERFATKVQEELGLNEQQVGQLRETGTRFRERRRELESREQELRAALDRQLRPGVAANRDSVTRLTDALVDLRLAHAQTFRDEHREVSRFLDPVQRAQLYMMRDRLMRRAHEVRRERHGHGGHGQEFRGRRRAPRGQARDSA